MSTEEGISSESTNISVGSKEADKCERTSVAGVNEKELGLPKDYSNGDSGVVDVGKSSNEEKASNDENNSDMLPKNSAKDVSSYSHVKKEKYYKMLNPEFDKICTTDAELYKKN